MAEVIVQGSFYVDPDKRSQVLEVTANVVRASREEEGCLEFIVAGDPVDPARVVISERWASREHLDRHLAAQRQGQKPPPGPAPAVRDREVNVYEIASSGPLG